MQNEDGLALPYNEIPCVSTTPTFMKLLKQKILLTTFCVAKIDRIPGGTFDIIHYFSW